MLPEAALAQRGRGGRGGGGRTVVIASHFNPYFTPYYNPFFWGFHQWGYPGPYPPAFYRHGFSGDSAARIQVTPRQTEVYVDGYRAGIVDDFDGFAQRLRLPPGEHVIELYLPGYRTITENVLFQPGETYRLRYDMVPLAPGETEPAQPMPRTAAPAPAPAMPPVIYDAFGRPSPMPPPAPAAAGAAVLAIRVQPADATVIVDGEQWQGSGAERLELQVTAGAHRIEIRKDGYLPFSTTVQAAAGQTTPINVSLTKGGE
ncbi:MAG: PEGA domain-containing protein [Vicinamibacterales bacterium]